MGVCLRLRFCHLQWCWPIFTLWSTLHIYLNTVHISYVLLIYSNMVVSPTCACFGNCSNTEHCWLKTTARYANANAHYNCDRSIDLELASQNMGMKVCNCPKFSCLRQVMLQWAFAVHKCYERRGLQDADLIKIDAFGLLREWQIMSSYMAAFSPMKLFRLCCTGCPKLHQVTVRVTKPLSYDERDSKRINLTP